MKTRKIFVTTIIFCVALLFCTSSSTFAQKLAYVNSQKILATFKDALDAQEKLDKINQDWEAEGREMQKEFQDLSEQLESQSLLLSDERKQEKQQEIQTLYLKIQKYSADKWGQNGEFFNR